MDRARAGRDRPAGVIVPWIWKPHVPPTPWGNPGNLKSVDEDVMQCLDIASAAAMQYKANRCSPTR
jgi:hypothetical protein